MESGHSYSGSHTGNQSSSPFSHSGNRCGAILGNRTSSIEASTGSRPPIGAFSGASRALSSFSSKTLTPLTQSTQSTARKTVGDRRIGFEKIRGVKHIPYPVLMERKARGQCFRCGEKYHSLHQCAERQLRLLILGDDEMVNEAGEVITIEEDDNLAESEGKKPVDIQDVGRFGASILSGKLVSQLKERILVNPMGTQREMALWNLFEPNKAASTWTSLTQRQNPSTATLPSCRFTWSSVSIGLNPMQAWASQITRKGIG